MGKQALPILRGYFVIQRLPKISALNRHSADSSLSNWRGFTPIAWL